MGGLPTLSSFLRVLTGTVAVVVVTGAGLLYTYQRSIIYPAAFPDGSRTVVETPDAYDIPYKEHFLATPDGEKLQVFVMRQASLEQRPTVLMLHANAGNMGHRIPLAAVFYKRLGCNVVMLSYRGYAQSTGEPSEAGLKIDAQTALDWIRTDAALRSTPLVLYGQSIGGAVAIFLAAQNPRTVRALILENTFLSIPELLPSILPMLSAFTFLCREIWPSATLIQKIAPSMPVLFLSGEQDEVVPPSHMRKLNSLCSSSNKEWHSFADATHNDTCIKSRYFDIIAAFLLKYVIDLNSVQAQSGDSSPRFAGSASPPRKFHADL